MHFSMCVRMQRPLLIVMSIFVTASLVKKDHVQNLFDWIADEKFSSGFVGGEISISKRGQLKLRWRTKEGIKLVYFDSRLLSVCGVKRVCLSGNKVSKYNCYSVRFLSTIRTAKRLPKVLTRVKRSSNAELAIHDGICLLI